MVVFRNKQSIEEGKGKKGKERKERKEKERKGKQLSTYLLSSVSYVAHPTTRVTLNGKILGRDGLFVDVIRKLALRKPLGLPHS